MLPTVIFARDKYLRPDTGIILPDKANLYLSCVTDETRDDKVLFLSFHSFWIVFHNICNIFLMFRLNFGMMFMDSL